MSVDRGRECGVANGEDVSRRRGLEARWAGVRGGEDEKVEAADPAVVLVLDVLTKLRGWVTEGVRRRVSGSF